jgi:hypothetical protein
MALNAHRRVAQAAAGGAWEPNDLGANLVAAYSMVAADGFLYDATNNTGSTVSANGDKVGSVREYYNASGLYLRNAGGANRPVVDTGGVKFGTAYSEGNALYCQGINAGNTSFTIVMRFTLYQSPSHSSGRFISIAKSAGNDYDGDGMILLCRQSGNNSGNLTALGNYQGGGETDIFDGTVAHGTFCTITYKYNKAAPTASIGVNGATSGTGFASVSVGSGVYLDRLGFSALAQYPGLDPVDTIIRRVVIANTLLTGSDLTSAEAWVAA